MMEHLSPELFSTAQEIIEIEQIVYCRLTDVFCKTGTKTYLALMNDKKRELRQTHETSDMGFIAQFKLIN